MQLHLKSLFQMLRHKRLNEAINTDTYFANENLIEVFHCIILVEMLNSLDNHGRIKDWD